MNHVHCLLILMTSFYLILGELNNTPKCLHRKQAANDKYYCPENTDLIVVTANRNLKFVALKCNNYSILLNINILPDIIIPNLLTIEIDRCIISLDFFLDIINKYNATVVMNLTLQNIPEHSINQNYFRNFKNLNDLSLISNHIKDPEKDLLKYTPDITIIDLKNNEIKLIPENFFIHTLQLEIINLSLNQIEILPNNLFQGLSQLKRLNLRENKLKVINEFIFKDLSNLRILNLKSNNIVQIAEQSFRDLTNLTNISMEDNPGLLHIPEFIFSALFSLLEINVSQCNISELSNNLFKDLSQLTKLSLHNNNLSTLKKELLSPLIKLKILDLNQNKIEVLVNLNDLINLEELHLDNNLIKRIETDTLNQMVNLQEIHLINNKIEYIDTMAFHTDVALRFVDLSHNQYSLHENLISPFSNCVHLERIDLSHNNLTDLSIVPMYNKPDLTFVDLSYNHFTSLQMHYLAMTGKRRCNLGHNRIKYVNFADIKEDDLQDTGDHSIEVILSENPIECDSTSYDLWRYYNNEMGSKVRNLFKLSPTTCGAPEEMSKRNVSDLDPLKLTSLRVNSGCPLKCSCFWRPRDKAFVVDCANRNLGEIPTLIISESKKFNHIEVLLQGNNLLIGLRVNHTGYDNVTKLNLSHNHIREFSWVPPQIEVLELDHNELTRLDPHVLKVLNSSGVRELQLDHNPWICDCQSYDFTEFLIENRRVKTNHIYCATTTKKLISVSRDEVCDKVAMVHIVVIILLVLLLWLMFLFVYYRYQSILKMWLFNNNLCLCWVSEEEVDKDKKYDAFISYSSLDSSFIEDKLQPTLEDGPQPYKLCLHHRDWSPGESIINQVVYSVENSRRTIVILSPNFLKSLWGKEEFRVAYAKVLSEGRARIIMLLYGDVDIGSLDSDLKAYLSTYNYIKWGERFFWNRLRYALPHYRQKNHVDPLDIVMAQNEEKIRKGSPKNTFQISTIV